MKYFSVFSFSREAKTLAHENRSTTVQTMLICGVISCACSFLINIFSSDRNLAWSDNLIAFVVLLAITLLLGPLSVGVANVFSDMANGKGSNLGDVFVWFGDGEKFRRSVFLTLLQSLILLGLISFFAVVVFGAGCLISPDIFAVPTQVATMEDYNALMQSAYTLIFLLFLVLIFSYAAYSMYIPSTYLLVNDPDATALECLKTSRRLTKPIRLKFIGLLATFALRGLGYIILFCVVLSMFMQNQTTAINLAGILAAIVILFRIAPHFHLTMVLLMRDLQAQQIKGV